MPTVKVIQSVSHGRYHLHEGETREDLPQADVNTLKELGFVEDADTTQTGTTQTGTTDSQEDLDDLVGGEKMADEAENKMAPAPTNKKAR